MAYPGGKGRIFRRIISMMPPHHTYIESHLGSGAVLRHKRPAVSSFGIDADPAVVARWRAGNGPPCTIVQGDAAEFLAAYPWSGDELVYADPPYLPETRRRERVYKHDYTASDHAALLRILHGLPCAVMLSGYPSATYDRMLRGWRAERIASPTQAGCRTEVLWMNFPPPRMLHDHAHLGADFRDREQIRRRRDRLVRRIGLLDADERHALLAEIVRREGPAIAALLGRDELVPPLAASDAHGA